MKVAVFGAAGAIGRPASAELRRRGHQVRLVGRTAASLERLAAGDPGFEIVPADLTDVAQTRRAAAGVDAIVYVVGVDYHRFALFPGMMRTAIEAAKAEGVRELLLIMSVYPYGRPQTPTVAETHPRAPQTRKGIYRNEQLQLLLDAHDPEGLRTTALVLPDFYGPGIDNSYVKPLVDSAVNGTAAQVLGSPDLPHEYVFVPDVAPVIADLLDRPELFGTSYHFGGPGTITQRAFGQLAYEAAGRDPATLKISSVPKWLLQTMGLGNTMMREVAEMYYLFEQPVVLDDSKLRAALPHLHKTPYAEGIRLTVFARREPAHV
ncbi:MAG: NAD(P)H-binding protein [Candidatus Velthaea sp.]|jgi:nucleoside-diphosphate-sugar epimerase